MLSMACSTVNKKYHTTFAFASTMKMLSMPLMLSIRLIQKFPAYSNDLPASFPCKGPSRQCLMNECLAFKELAGFIKVYSSKGFFNNSCRRQYRDVDKDGRKGVCHNRTTKQYNSPTADWLLRKLYLCFPGWKTECPLSTESIELVYSITVALLIHIFTCACFWWSNTLQSDLIYNLHYKGYNSFG